MVISTGTKWLTVSEFCQRFGLGKNLVYESVRQRRLRSMKLGGKILIDADALDKLAERLVESEEEELRERG